MRVKFPPDGQKAPQVEITELVANGWVFRPGKVDEVKKTGNARSGGLPENGLIIWLDAEKGGRKDAGSTVAEIKLDPEVERLSKESDESFTAANKQLAEAGTLFQSVLDAVDKDGLPSVRTQKKESVEKVAALYEEASQKLRLAAQKADDAAAKKPGEKLEGFLKTKATAYREFAAAREINRDIARMILDETIKTGEELVAKVTEPAARRDKLEASATETAARADKLVQDSKK